MYNSLRLQNFRNYQDYVMELTHGVNIVVGPNTSGKTNLLEAVYALSQMKTWRGSLKETVMDGKTWARLDGDTPNGQRTLKINPPKRPELLIDDKQIKPKDRWSKQVPTVLFEPDNLRLLRGSPQRRREFLDDILGKSDRLYGEHLAKYNRALQQRNRLLKNDQLNNDELFVWDIKLAEHGSYLVSARTELVKSLKSRLSEHYSAVSGKKQTVIASYLSNTPENNSGLIKALHLVLVKDRSLGFTSVGPHRDDLSFRIDGKDAQSHASRGETRSLVLALKLVEDQITEGALGAKPILLLDDVFSELDASRRRHLTEYLIDRQTIITTTDADAVLQHFSAGYHTISLKTATRR